MSEFDPETRPACDRGDDEAFATLYDQTAPGIFDFLARVVRDRSTAEDLTQSTFVRAFESRSSVRDPATVVAWRFRITNNLALNHLTRPSRTDSHGEHYIHGRELVAVVERSDRDRERVGRCTSRLVHCSNVLTVVHAASRLR